MTPAKRPRPPQSYYLLNLAAVMLVTLTLFTPPAIKACLFIDTAMTFALQRKHRRSAPWYAIAATLWAVEELHDLRILFLAGMTLIAVAVAIDIKQFFLNDDDDSQDGERAPAPRQNEKATRAGANPAQAAKAENI